MSPDIPGTKTWVKPLDDIRTPSKDDESIYRVDNADDLAKEQSTPDSIDHSKASPGSYGKGTGDEVDSPKTKYPYRDGVPNAHNASAEFVAGLWLLKTAHTLYVPAESKVKVAARISEILEGLNPKTTQKATSCKASLKRVDVNNLRWILSVECGNGAKVVHIKATRKGNVTKLSKMDLMVSCSCPAWQWLGPEHHASTGEYLDKDPRGTASVPFIRDPQNQNLVCKHVAAALSLASGWDVPQKPKKG